MTVEERLLFIRAGYSAQDIANFENAENFAKPEQEQKSEQEPEQKPEVYEPTDPAELKEAMKKAAEPDSEPAWAKALAESIKTLTAATQAANRRFDDMGEPEQVADKALEALKNIYGGKN